MDENGCAAGHSTGFVQTISVLEQAVDRRREVVDEVGVWIESSAGLADGIALTVKDHDRRELRKLTAEALERNLIGVAQHCNGSCRTCGGLELLACKLTWRVNAHPAHIHVFTLISFGERLYRRQPCVALRVLDAAKEQHCDFSAHARHRHRLAA